MRMKEERGLQICSVIFSVVMLGVFASGCYFLQTPPQPIEDSIEEVSVVEVETAPEMTVSEIFEEVFEIEAEEEVVPLSEIEANAQSVGWTWETPLSLAVEMENK